MVIAYQLQLQDMVKLKYDWASYKLVLYIINQSRGKSEMCKS
jgi:hypothetical protein